MTNLLRQPNEFYLTYEKQHCTEASQEVHWNRLDKKAFSRSRTAHLLLLQMHTLLHILLICYSIINGLDFRAKPWFEK